MRRAIGICERFVECSVADPSRGRMDRSVVLGTRFRGHRVLVEQLGCVVRPKQVAEVVAVRVDESLLIDASARRELSATCCASAN
jgi:hypothetical protein